MTDSNLLLRKVHGLQFPRRTLHNSSRVICAPSHASFATQFGDAYPTPSYIDSALGRLAVYDLPPPSGHSALPIVMIHGLNTPALGMWPLAREVQALNTSAHIVLFDLWGHGLSDTPIVPHGSELCQFQILEVLAFMHWTQAHIIGYSFGGATAVRFAPSHMKNVLSVALLAPGGILSNITSELRSLLDDQSGARDEDATRSLLDFLEGGPLTVPRDWKQRVGSGKVVAEALRDWELREHAGYTYSVLSMFREGGVYDSEEHFRRFAKQDIKQLTILADQDAVCTAEQLRDLGFRNVRIIPNAGHSFVRSRPKEIAVILNEFWPV